MATRTERVVLTLQDDFSADMAKAAASTQLLARSLKDVDGKRVGGDLDKASTSSTRLAKSSKDADTAVGRLGPTMRKTSGDSKAFSRDVDRAGSSIDQFSGRLGLMASAIGALGPSLVPLGAGLIPAISGLSAGLGAMAASAGVAVAAFAGMGDAMEALEAAQLEPTAANIAALRTEFDSLGPAGAEFALYLDGLKPKMEQLQQAARSGLFPGLESGIDELLGSLPQVEDFITRLSTKMGDLAEDAAVDLTGEGWSDFFNYINRDGSATLEAFANSAGNVAQGVAQLFADLAPLSNDFAAGLENATASFADWAAGVSETEGFRDFLDYVRTSGPQVVDMLASAGEAVLALVQAAAPVGSVMLPALTELADVFATIMGSDLGTPIMAMVTAMSALNLATKGWSKVSTTAFGSKFIAGTRQASTGIRMLRTDLVAMRNEYSRLGRAQAVALSGFSNTTGAAQRTRATLAQIGKAGAGVAAIGLLATGTAEKMDMANTATLAFAGSMAGPWGAAIGAGAGAIMDLKADYDGLTDAIDESNKALDGSDFDRVRASMKGLAEEMQSVTAFRSAFSEMGQEGDLSGMFDYAKEIDGNALKFFSDGLKQLTGNADEADRKFATMRASMDGFKQITNELGTSTEQTSAYMSQLGISAEDVGKAVQSGAGVDSFVEQIRSFNREAESVSGRTDAVGAAIRQLGEDAISTADSATALSDALNALISPTLDAEAATDAWRTSLKELRSELSSDAGFKGYGEQAVKNRELTRDYVDTSMERLTALANVTTTTEGDMARAVRQTRQEFIQSGIDAGISREQITKRANALGLTPKLVRTVFENAGVSETEQAARNLNRNLKGIPKSVRTQLKADPGNSERIINNALRKLDLTERERRALISIRDNATPKARAVNRDLDRLARKKTNPKVGAETGAATRAVNAVSRLLDNVGRQKPTPKVGADTSSANSKLNETKNKADQVDSTDPNVNVSATDNASGTLSGIKSAVDNIPGSKLVTITVRKVGAAIGGLLGRADGGTVPGARWPYADKMLTMLAPGEEVISNRHGQADRYRADRAAGRIPHYADGGTVSLADITFATTRGPQVQAFADGGTVQRLANGGTVARRRNRDGDGGKNAKAAAKALRQLRRQLEKTTKQLGRNQKTLKTTQKTLEDETRARNDLVSGVKSGLSRDIWAAPEAKEGTQTWNSKWAGGAAPVPEASVRTVSAQLRQQRAEAAEFNRIMKQLIARGLSGGALAEISAGGLERARMFKGQSRGQIAAFERLYNSTQATVNAAASRVGDTAATTKQLAGLRKDVKGLEKTIKTLDNRREKLRNRIETKREKSRKNNAKRTGKAAGNAVKGAAKKGRRNRR